jgi:hypothetical protein
LDLSVSIRRAREAVVGEQHPVTHEHLVFDRYAVAQERVTGDLAARTDDGAALDLDECGDASVVTDAAAIHVRGVVHGDALTELSI